MADIISIIVVTPEPQILLIDVVVGQPGPAGPAGADGGSVIKKITGAAIGGGRAVYLDGADLLQYASADDMEKIRTVLGVTQGAAGAGAESSVIRTGEMADSGWTWTPNAAIYLGLNGVLTQVVPTLPTSIAIVVLGYAITSTKAFFQPRDPIVLI